MTLNRIFVSYEHDYKVVNIYLFHHSITRSFFFSVRHLLVKKIVDMPTLCGCLFKKNIYTKYYWTDVLPTGLNIHLHMYLCW